MALDPQVDFTTGLSAVMAKVGVSAPVTNPRRLSGGANLESWLFDCGDESFVLRRAPSEEWIAGRPLSMEAEAAIVRHAHAGGVPAPEVVAELQPADGIGQGFIMRCLAGTADPEVTLSSPPSLGEELAVAMARIHALDPAGLPFLKVLEPAEGVEGLYQQFLDAGGDRPIIALGLAWLRANLPPAAEPKVVHGDLRIGNVMSHEGRLSGVLDWELTHLGDGHEDFAYGCMTVWRFGRLDKLGFGLTDIDTLARAYEAAGGEKFDPVRFRFWLVYRTVWWALGTLGMGKTWRSGVDRQIERVVVGRRTSEQELDLLRLLEGDAPEAERARKLAPAPTAPDAGEGEPTAIEILTAVSEWLASTVKERLSGRERWELAVTQNALGIVRRQLARRPDTSDQALTDDILAGRATLSTPGLLADLRRRALDTLSADMPKYPALAQARGLWE